MPSFAARTGDPNGAAMSIPRWPAPYWFGGATNPRITGPTTGHEYEPGTGSCTFAGATTDPGPAWGERTDEDAGPSGTTTADIESTTVTIARRMSVTSRDARRSAWRGY